MAWTLMIQGRWTRLPRNSALVGLASLASVGCGLVINGQEVGDEGGVEADLLEYEELGASLDDDREQALDSAAAQVRTAGPWLAWTENQTIHLRRYPDQFELELPLMAIGGTEFDYRLSESHVLVAAVEGGETRYRGHALPDGGLVDEPLIPGSPSSYTLLGNVAFVVAEGELWRWPVGAQAPALLGALADAGVPTGEIAALEATVVDTGVAMDERLLLGIDGQLWSLEVSSFAASSVASIDQLLAVGERGALFTRDVGLYLLDWDGSILAIDEAIAASGWSLNPTFPAIHEYAGIGATLAGDGVLYISSAGLFAYALDLTGPEAITPVLLEPRWDVNAGVDRIEYREPQVAKSTVFVRGLLGPNGELGTSGPVFSSRLP